MKAEKEKSICEDGCYSTRPSLVKSDEDFQGSQKWEHADAETIVEKIAKM